MRIYHADPQLRIDSDLVKWTPADIMRYTIVESINIYARTPYMSDPAPTILAWYGLCELYVFLHIIPWVFAFSIAWSNYISPF